jgi:hypothetical protein
VPATAAILACFAVQAVSQSSASPKQHQTSRKDKEGTVSLTLKQVAERATATLSASEKDSSAVYLDSTEIKGGTSVDAGRITIEAPWDSYLSFVDLQPAVNWGHSCRYLLVNVHTGEVKTFEASFPPFLKGPSKTLQLIWRGARVPEWALAVR